MELCLVWFIRSTGHCCLRKNHTVRWRHLSYSTHAQNRCLTRPSELQTSYSGSQPDLTNPQILFHGNTWNKMAQFRCIERSVLWASVGGLVGFHRYVLQVEQYAKSGWSYSCPDLQSFNSIRFINRLNYASSSLLSSSLSSSVSISQFLICLFSAKLNPPKAIFELISPKSSTSWLTLSASASAMGPNITRPKNADHPTILIMARICMPSSVPSPFWKTPSLSSKKPTASKDHTPQTSYELTASRGSSMFTRRKIHDIKEYRIPPIIPMMKAPHGSIF